eukprot:9499988-Pyramimonas_sp.AAC.1
MRIMYLSMDRPDISYAMSTQARHMKEPREQHGGLEENWPLLEEVPCRAVAVSIAGATRHDQRILRQRLRRGPDYEAFENGNGRTMGIASAETWQCGQIHCEPQQRRGRAFFAPAWISPPFWSEGGATRRGRGHERRCE